METQRTTQTPKEHKLDAQWATGRTFLPVDTNTQAPTSAKSDGELTKRLRSAKQMAKMTGGSVDIIDALLPEESYDVGIGL